MNPLARTGSSKTPTNSIKLEDISKRIENIRQEIERKPLEGEWASHTVTHVSGLLYKLRWVQKEYAALKNETEMNDVQNESLKTLETHIVTLEKKLEKVEKVRDLIVPQLNDTSDNDTWKSFTGLNGGKSRTYHYQRDAEKNLTIVSDRFLKKTNKKLGGGSFGTVSGREETSTVQAAVKTPNLQAVSSVYQLNNEKKVLQELHKKGPIVGIVPAPDALVNLGTKMYLVGERFISNLSDPKDIPQAEILDGFGKILSEGLPRMHKKNTSMRISNLRTLPISATRKTPSGWQILAVQANN